MTECWLHTAFIDKHLSIFITCTVVQEAEACPSMHFQICQQQQAFLNMSGSLGFSAKLVLFILLQCFTLCHQPWRFDLNSDQTDFMLELFLACFLQNSSRQTEDALPGNTALTHTTLLMFHCLAAPPSPSCYWCQQYDIMWKLELKFCQLSLASKY